VITCADSWPIATTQAPSGIPSGVLKKLDVRQEQSAQKRPARRRISWFIGGRSAKSPVQPSGVILSPANHLTVA
jgi:hypothetical protein